MKNYLKAAVYTALLFGGLVGIFTLATFIPLEIAKTIFCGLLIALAVTLIYSAILGELRIKEMNKINYGEVKKQLKESYKKK